MIVEPVIVDKQAAQFWIGARNINDTLESDREVSYCGALDFNRTPGAFLYDWDVFKTMWFQETLILKALDGQLDTGTVNCDIGLHVNAAWKPTFGLIGSWLIV